MISVDLFLVPVLVSQAPQGPHCHTQSPQGAVVDWQGLPPLSGKISGMHFLILVPSAWHCPHGVESLQTQSVGGQAFD
jgi:hypothetical protein